MNPRLIYLLGALTAWVMFTPSGKNFGNKLAEKATVFLTDMTKENKNENKENL